MAAKNKKLKSMVQNLHVEMLMHACIQNHCVASYARSCFSGKNSIWTMDKADSNGATKMVTIEVDLQSKKICQIRGKRNRLPTITEVDIVRRWARKGTLAIEAFCLGIHQ